MGDRTDFKTILLEREDGVATITLNRPDRLNAFTEEMLEELLEALDLTDADDDVRAVIFTGSGRAFCAGADLGRGGDTFKRDDEPFSLERHADGGGRLTLRLFDSAKPLIAAVNGPAVGVGVTMTLPMDVRLAADSARFGFVFAKRGIVPEACSSFFLPRVVVRSIHPADELLPAARALATEFQDGTAPVAVAIARRMLWRILADGSPAKAHEFDSEALHFLGASDDVREGVVSFLEKREADFPMRVSRDMPDFYERWRIEHAVAE
jgi:enoyl-CoA hydratase/carnithine racemase